MGAVGNYEVVEQAISLTSTPSEFSIPAPEGKKVFSGHVVAPEFGSVTVSHSYPSDDGEEWVFLAYASPNADVDFRVVCAEMC